MNISLTPELEKLVADRVASGRYASASEVVREGLRMLADFEEAKQQRLEQLRREIQKGLDSGPSVPLDMERIKAEARKMSAESKRKR
jgi:antitoxin ParD1/3/4